jgi:hypothetical protein
VSLWRLRHSLWLLTPLLGLGPVTWAAFLHVGRRTHHRPWLVASAVYGLAAIAVIAVFSTTPEGATRSIDAIAGLAVIAVWAGGFLHALVVNPRYLRMIAGPGTGPPPPG